MASRQVLSGECGLPNPVLRLMNRVTHDQALKQDVLRPAAFQHSQRDWVNTQVESSLDERFVNEFVNERDNSAPQTFHMGHLLQEMQNIQQEGAMLSAPLRPPEASQQLASEWLDEFSEKTTPSTAGWNGGNERMSEMHHSHPNLMFGEETPWVNETMSATAARLLDQVDDKQFSHSEFMKFVATLKNNGQMREESSDIWTDEFGLQQPQTQGFPEANAWAGQMNQDELKTIATGEDVDFWDNLEQEWQKLAQEDHLGEHPWLTDFKASTDRNHEYKFEEDNPLQDHPSPFAEGLAKLREGNLPAAVLAFEAAVKRDPEHKEAWLYLGTTHAENEQDPAAIAALKRCLNLDPTNLNAWMSIAVSYTNESYQEQACHALSEWIKCHPRYKDLVGKLAGTPAARHDVTTILNRALFSQVLDLYLAAAKMSPVEPDAEVQCGLGVLLNLSGDYDKAVDCFHAALATKPQDALLWNRLGATLANCNRSEEAISAYHRALELSPGFIRSRYNLGISCISLGAHKEAVEHFLSALNIQMAGYGAGHVNSSTAISDNIWSTLRMALSLANRTDLYAAVDTRDLSKLNSEFPADS